ncbi:MAG: IS630 family transposase [Gammaproteobacteria bacterium]|nr:MAG: IS630 family transposase [Gammaproteobacteria bacterium]
MKTGKNARQIYRANALNLRSKGLTAAEVADFLEITVRTVFNIEKNYEDGGLQKALYDDPRPGSPVRLDERFKSYVVATVCSKPPEGFDRWTLELIQEEVLKSSVVDRVSQESIRLVLKEHDLKPWQQKSWCVPKIDQEFICRMEDVLEVYQRRVQAAHPLVCLDEKPIQLLDHVRPASGIAPGKCRKVDYEYKRKGTCNVFCAVEPHAGHYIAEVTQRRTGDDFARFMQSLEQHYQKAEKITLVMDNLNTHKESSLIGLFGENKARGIWQRFEVHYTPIHGSWLNQAEIAINLYARQCLGKSRIPDIELLRKKTKAWLRYINDKVVCIKWTFSKDDARKKFAYL